MNHDVIWTQPPALLNSAAATLLPTARAAFEAPAILRFDHDAFMQEFLDLLATSPERLTGYKVRRETWRGFAATPAPEPPKITSLVRQRLGILRPRAASPAPAVSAAVAAATNAVPAGTPLKLYQPAHQRHYLVASSLVCRVPGLPDRGVEPGRGERTAFVVRRLLPPAGDDDRPVEAWDEHAWVPGEQG
jgi:hypothetical protein